MVTISGHDGSLSGSDTLTQAAGPPAAITLGLSPQSIAADGHSTSTATVTLADANGNRVAGDPVSLSASDPAVGIGAVAGHADGSYTATITSSTTAHQVTITAHDGNLSDSNTLTQTVGPIAAFGFSPSSASTGDAVSFDGTGSSDDDAPITSYRWDFGDGTTGTGATPSHSFARPDHYTVALTVTDAHDHANTTTHLVTVANRAPAAAFSFSPSSPLSGQTVTFDGSGSSDPDGSITAYAWDFGDGATGTGQAPSHSYALAGQYTATLTVTDDKGATGTTSRTIAVGDQAGSGDQGVQPSSEPPSSPPQQQPGDGATPPLSFGHPGTPLAASIGLPHAIRWPSLIHRGLGVRVRCSMACTAVVRLLVPQTHRVVAERWLTIGRRTVTRASAAPWLIHVRLTPARAVDAARSHTLRVVIVVGAPGQRPVRLIRQLTLNP